MPEKMFILRFFTLAVFVFENQKVEREMHLGISPIKFISRKRRRQNVINFYFLLNRIGWG